MSELVLFTYDWVPDAPRGFVRDLRVRWALEEAGLPYRVESVSFAERSAEHFAHQPFGQVPWLQDGDVSIFESGAILLHLGAMSPALMPEDPAGRARVTQWVFAALNSVEMASLPLMIFRFSGDTTETPGRKGLEKFLEGRLGRMETALAGREWIAGDFSIADILMSDVLRSVERAGGLGDYPVCRAYVERATARPAFVKAYDDQIAHFAAADG